LYRRTRSKPDTEDLAQETFLRFLKIPSDRAIHNPQAYLFSIAINLVRARGRDNEDHKMVNIADESIVPELPAEVPSFVGAIESDRREKRLHEILPRLPPRCYSALMLHYWHKWTYAQIAEKFEVSTSMVKKILQQGIKHCRNSMGEP
jgi:RNA polymerase sigma-70 factor (ECF subfamily)